MRIVRHPNIVELKAFYYSNGDRVCANDSWSSAMILSSLLSFFLPPSPSLSPSPSSPLSFSPSFTLPPPFR